MGICAKTIWANYEHAASCISGELTLVDPNPMTLVDVVLISTVMMRPNLCKAVSYHTTERFQ